MEGSRGRKHAAASARRSAAACGSVSQPPGIESVVAGSRSVSSAARRHPNPMHPRRATAPGTGARRGPERREDDAPWERRRPPVAAAGEKAADAADGERHQPCRDERVEQLARRPPCHARDDERRSQACRDATGGREPARPEHAASPVEEREKHVSADQGHRGDGRRGDQHGRRLARAADGEDRTRTDAEHDGEAVQRDDDLGAADDDAKRGEHAAGCKTRAGALRRVADSRTRALKQLLSVPCCTDHGTAPDGGSEERTPFTNRRASY